MAKDGGGGRGGGGGGGGSSSGGGGTGVDGGVTQTPEGDVQPNGRLGEVRNQEEFNDRMAQLGADLSREFDLDGAVPIFILRRAAPNLSREEFDRYLGGMVTGDRIRLSAGGSSAAYQSVGGRIPIASNTRNFRDPRNQAIQNARSRDSYTTRTGASRDMAFFTSKER